jgi:hypothetical protein
MHCLLVPKKDFAVMTRPVLCALAMMAVSLPVMADDAVPNLVANAPAVAPGGAMVMVLAQQLYAVGVANKDALMVVTAARMAGSVDAKDTERKKTTEGKALPGQTPTDALPISATEMLARARELAGEDDTLQDLLDEVRPEGGLAMTAASRSLSELQAGQGDSWQVAFFGNSYAEVAVLGSGASNLDVRVMDEGGNTVCLDVGATDYFACNFTPAVNGYFMVQVQNTGMQGERYYLITN